MDDPLDLARNGPLAGIRVIDMAYWISGPAAAALLADMGADVIKVENAGGDLIRAIGQRPNGFNGLFEWVNRSKRGAVLDVLTPSGREAIHRLVATADVFLENFRPGTLERLGLGWEELHAKYPRLIHAKATGFGDRGPDATLPAFDVVASARSGYLLAQGAAEGRPRRPLAPLADLVTAKDMAQGITLALFARERTGRGQQVMASLLGSQIALQGIQVTDHLYDARPATMRHPDGDALSTWYTTADGKWVVISLLHHRFWPNLCDALGRPDLVSDPRFETPQARVDHGPELRALMAELFATKSRAEWLALMREHDVPAGAVQNHAEMAADPQVIANEFVVSVEHAVYGTLRQSGWGFALRETPAAIRRAAPQLGEHTAEILAELGYDEDEAAEVIAASLAP
jgi:crotonobetainyl-CoA:carnitine CoA-transferase CaiB-like acyl-CoA transferase